MTTENLDIVIRGGEIATTTTRAHADIGIRGGKIACLGHDLSAPDIIDATGKLILPGGIEAHCHIAQESGMGLMSADDYETGSISAAFGGNSSFVPFAAQRKGWGVLETLDIYDGRAKPKSVIDWGYHLIISDPTPEVLTELPRAFERGVTSFKVFMTYDISIDDGQFLDILSVAKAHGAITMVHAENKQMIGWATDRLLAGGHVAPKYHAPSRPAMAEVEAINRAISLAGMVDAPLFIVHVSTPRGADLVRKAHKSGAKVWAETCPQYLFLTAEDLDRPEMEGAKYICSPPVRDRATQDVLWRHIQMGTFTVVSSDHAPYRADETGKFHAGPDAPFNKIANGMPGIEMRLPMMFSEGVVKGRIPLGQFVGLSSTNAARLYGMSTKGDIAVGLDADLAIWDPAEEWVAGEMHDNMDYNPFAGMTITGRPVTVLTRGNRIVENGELVARPGDGRFVPRDPVDLTGRRGGVIPELDPAKNFGAEIAP
ncbi:MAG: dihydropyrimidinase [Pseudomonadota bacterium]